MKSTQLSSVLHTPGVFYNDNPYVFPHELLYSDDDSISHAPFPCHIARDAKSNIEDGLFAGHILYGESQKIKVGLSGVANSNTFDAVSGSGLLFSSHAGPRRTTDHHDSTGSDGYPQSGACFRMMTNNMIPHPTGLYLGKRTPDEILIDNKDNDTDVNSYYNTKARWCSPLGVQFKWSSRGSKKASGAINFSKITLMYMDNWMPGRTLYMPLIVDNSFISNKSYYDGSDPFDTNYGSSASGTDRAPQGMYGEIVAYAEPEVIEYLQDSYTRAVCVGMYIELLQPIGQGANYDISREIFDFKFLFDMPDNRGNMFASNSMFVYPAPYSLEEALYGNTLKLL